MTSEPDCDAEGRLWDKIRRPQGPVGRVNNPEGETGEWAADCPLCDGELERHLATHLAEDCPEGDQ